MLLDAAEPEIRRIVRLSTAAKGLFITHGRETATRAKYHMDTLRDTVRAADAQAGRLALRLGAEHPLAESDRRAYDAAVTLFDALDMARMLGEQVRIRETAAKVDSALAQLTAAHDDFLSAADTLAATRVGPLPPPSSSSSTPAA